MQMSAPTFAPQHLAIGPSNTAERALLSLRRSPHPALLAELARNLWVLEAIAEPAVSLTVTWHDGSRTLIGAWAEYGCLSCVDLNRTGQVVSAFDFASAEDNADIGAPGHIVCLPGQASLTEVAADVKDKGPSLIARHRHVARRGIDMAASNIKLGAFGDAPILCVPHDSGPGALFYNLRDQSLMNTDGESLWAGRASQTMFAPDHQLVVELATDMGSGRLAERLIDRRQQRPHSS